MSAIYNTAIILINILVLGLIIIVRAIGHVNKDNFAVNTGRA